ncbi:MAG: tRNA (adenosine(37)-N6)-threonylcarbamoyltransferase complex transferase subunit TsaD [bacterium]
MIILAIETSCDETAAAVLKAETTTTEPEESVNFEILSNIVSSQVGLHSQFGGIIPNLAAREHTKNITSVLEEALQKSAIKIKDIDLITVTRGPGLIPALLVGTSAAKTLSYVWEKPIVGVNHIEGHIYANWIENPPTPFTKGEIKEEPRNISTLFLKGISLIFPPFRRGTKGDFKNIPGHSTSPASADFGGREKEEIKEIIFPVLALVVSGGHTELVLMKDHKKFISVGATRDDAVGEAFDKAARLLNLGYPGGPAISKAAENGTPGIYSLPRPMISSKNFDFSFSGIKTAVRELDAKTANGAELQPSQANNIAAEFQQAVVEVLISKTIKAAHKFSPKTIILAGGVAANSQLRFQLAAKIKNTFPEIKFSVPPLQFCTDNAAMIAVAGYFHRQEATRKPWEVETDANINVCPLL